MARRTQSLSAWRANFGKTEPKRMPGKLVGIGPNSPRISGGASGFGSQVECCGGPPIRNRTTQFFALAVELGLAWTRASEQLRERESEGRETADAERGAAGEPIAQARGTVLKVQHS